MALVGLTIGTLEFFRLADVAAVDRRAARCTLRAGDGAMIAIITLIIVAVQFAIVHDDSVMGGKSNEDDRARTEKVIRDNDAARKHIKAELMDD